MEFLNTKTNGGFKRVRMGKSPNRLRKASVIDKEKNETGHLAVIQGVTIDNPRKLRGDRMERIFFEESGSNPHLITTYNQAEALVNIQGTRFGVRFVWGTGGDSGPALAGLAKMFYEPESFNMLPYKHNHTQTGEYVYTAFFVPAYSMVTKFCDHRGVCDEIEAKQYYNTERLKKSSDPQNLLEYKSEYCFYPEEALIREGSNRFDSALLAEQIANIELHKLVEQPRNARLTYPYNRDIGTIDYSQSPKLEYHSSGKIQIIEEPIKDDNDIPYANLYVVGIDGIDADKSTSSGQKDVSNFAVVVKRRALGLMEPKYVAIYKDRPKDIREAHTIALALCEYYNAKAMVEATRVSVITFFKEKKKSNLLFRRPKAVSATISKTNSNQFGCPAVQQYIDHELDLIECYINDYYYNIHHLELLQELIKYSYENKRKFDLVAAMQMAELADEEMMGKTPKRISQSTEGWRDIGYYIDEYGIKRYGVIPKDVNNNRKKQYDKSYRWLRTQNI